jgi:hypothetical protein
MKTLISLITLVASLAVAQAQSYIANIDVAQEVPTGGGRSGSGVLNLSLSGTTMTVNGSFSGLSANSSLAHIHGPAAVGVSTSPIYNFGTLGLITLGGTSGTMSGSFNIAPIGAYTVAQQLADLNNSLWYFNIHSTTFGGGEIRGQITAVPEPSTLGMVGLGLGGFVLWMRRRRTQ